MDWKATGTTIGQTLFTFGILIIIIGGGYLIFSCPRWVQANCLDNEGNQYFNLVALAIMGAGVALFIIGWLVMKEEKVDEPTSSPNI
jgi:nitrate reductase gamma subunit